MANNPRITAPTLNKFPDRSVATPALDCVAELLEAVLEPLLDPPVGAATTELSVVNMVVDATVVVKVELALVYVETE
jgi:hypothetical protein